MQPSKTQIDWLRWRVQAEPLEILEAIRPMFADFDEPCSLGKYGRGSSGWQQSSYIHVGPVPVVRMDYGGDSQRGWVRCNMSGEGCGFVSDWSAVSGLASLKRSQIRRLDIALTTWGGEVGHEDVVAAHSSGRFTTRGRPPALQQITSSDPTAGRTCYVGSRRGAKYFRGYEKGWELIGKLRPVRGFVGSLGVRPEGYSIDGHAAADIYRCEVELKDVGMPIAWDVIAQRDAYFAGSYPFLGDLLPDLEARVFEREAGKSAAIELEAALANVREQYGGTLYTALHAYHGDIGAVWEQVCGDKHNHLLVDAGVLLSKAGRCVSP